MNEQFPLADIRVAISISDSPDMAQLGLAEAHLQDAMVEIARHLLALGAHLMYGGDLRRGGFTETLFELVARHQRSDSAREGHPSVTSYLPWPVHMGMRTSALQRLRQDLAPAAEILTLDSEGSTIDSARATLDLPRPPTEQDWVSGLTGMRKRMTRDADARVILGGRTSGYKGSAPGVAEETELTLRADKPVFLLGGFGGAARDIAASLGVAHDPYERTWPGREFFHPELLSENGLTREENRTLAMTPHVDQAVTLVLRGMLHKFHSKNDLETAF